MTWSLGVMRTVDPIWEALHSCCPDAGLCIGGSSLLAAIVICSRKYSAAIAAGRCDSHLPCVEWVLQVADLLFGAFGSLTYGNFVMEEVWTFVPLASFAFSTSAFACCTVTWT